MPTHLALDQASGLVLCAAAGTMKDETIAVRVALLALRLFEVTASLTTDPIPAPEA